MAATDLPFRSGKFDLVLMLETIEHFGERWRFALRRDPHFGMRFLALFPAPLRIERVLTRSRLPRRWFWDAIVARR